MPSPVKATIRRIRRYSRQYATLTDADLKQQGLGLKYLAMVGRSIEQLIPQGFALVMQATKRCLNVEHYDVQLACGIHLVAAKIAEMKTGEGKTLTAALPVFLHALSGRGVHVATVNDYLAKRDHDELKPIFEMLGLSVGVVTRDATPDERAIAYRRDITYGSSKEFGFDFLRDRLKRLQSSSDGASTNAQPVQRPLNFVLVDEADSILIDEARTPLIIGMIDREEEQVKQACYLWATRAAPNFVEDIDFTYDRQRQKVNLNVAGRQRLRELPQDKFTQSVSIRELNDVLENAIKVRRDFQLDRDYAVVADKVVIIDEFTGRPADGRQWQGGIHQSVEAKENIPITPATRQAATVTVQSFFRQYRQMAGMTGTAWTSRREFRKVYRKSVVRIPCHRPVRRNERPVKIFSSADTKFQAIAAETLDMLSQGRSVLIGTRSVDKSERLSVALTSARIEHRVLNANNLPQEAEIIAAAGQPNAVTVATNMAGRGTDIKLHPSVKSAGGLHVILTEIHESARIDWQLIGRGARQGDSGSFRIFVSLDDELIESAFGPRRAERIRKIAGSRSTHIRRSAFAHFKNAQRKLERKHLVDRMILLKRDRDRQERLFETGQDPWLDVVG